MGTNEQDLEQRPVWTAAIVPDATHNDPLLPGHWHLKDAVGVTKRINVSGVAGNDTINYGAQSETIRLVGVTSLSPTDYRFV